jgi:hypothetical protein
LAGHELRRWEAAGRPGPAPFAAKQATISEHARRHGCSLLVETGTYLGDTSYAQSRNFRRVITIEVAEPIHRWNVGRFRGIPNVEARLGDSGKVLREVVPGIAEPVLYWLDGHFSGGPTGKGEKECPIYEELSAIFASSREDFVVLIDDARLFDGTHDFPTYPELVAWVAEARPELSVTSEGDIIRIVHR